MTPFQVQWCNTSRATRPWVEFLPKLYAIATDEAGAITSVENILREKHAFMNRPEPLRAVEISWEEYEKIR